MRDSAGDEQYRIDYDRGRGWIWCDKYGNVGGDNIDLVSEIDGKTGYADAVYKLLGTPTARDLPQRVQRPQIERKPPTLPDYTHNDRMRGRVYLSAARGACKDSIEAAEAAGILSYGQDAVYFVGRDKAGRVRNVTERSYERRGSEAEWDGGSKRDLRGSEKRYAPVLPGDTGRVVVVEGGADGLAAHTIARLKKKEAPTIIITGGAGARSWIDEHADILRKAQRITVMRDREDSPEKQARTDAMHAEQERRIAAVAPGAAVVSQMPPDGYKDLAEAVRAHIYEAARTTEMQTEMQTERAMGR